MSYWKNFLLAYIAVFLILGGAAGFLGFHDKDTHYDFRTARDSPPERMRVTTYEVLSEREREIVDAAIAGDRLVNVFEEKEMAPGGGTPVVRKDGTYYVFNVYATFDWLDYHTYVPFFVFLSGVGMAVMAIKRDISSRAPV
jgi:hypothetical protein